MKQNKTHYNATVAKTNEESKREQEENEDDDDDDDGENTNKSAHIKQQR